MPMFIDDQIRAGGFNPFLLNAARCEAIRVMNKYYLAPELLPIYADHGQLLGTFYHPCPDVARVYITGA